MKVELISWTNNPIKTCEIAASQCYNSKPSLAIINHCIQSGHLSVLEHCNFTFCISGISRSLSHQLVRHRIASYTQRSQRYCIEDNSEMIEPVAFLKTKDTVNLHEIFSKLSTILKDGYVQLINEGALAEDARSILPNACATQIVLTMNLRSLAHFMNERLCSRAQYEIRTMAKHMVKAITEKRKEMGLTFDECDLILSLLVPKCEAQKIHFCPEKKSCGRCKTAEEINKILEEKS